MYFLTRHTVYGGIFCTKRNLCITILCSWSCEASFMLSKKVFSNPSEEITFLQTVSTQQATSVCMLSCTQHLLLLWSGLCLLTTVTGKCTPHFQGSCGGFAVLLSLQANLAQIALHHASAACSSSSKRPLNASRPTPALVPAYLESSRLSSCIMTTCLDRLLTAVSLTCGNHCTHHSTCMLFHQRMHLMLIL